MTPSVLPLGRPPGASFGRLASHCFPALGRCVRCPACGHWPHLAQVWNTSHRTVPCASLLDWVGLLSSQPRLGPFPSSPARFLPSPSSWQNGSSASPGQVLAHFSDHPLPPAFPASGSVSFPSCHCRLLLVFYFIFSVCEAGIRVGPYCTPSVDTVLG